MKIVRLENNIIVEIIPEYALPVSQWYGEEFARQCVEAPDEVLEGWFYSSELKEFAAEPFIPIDEIKTTKVEELREKCNITILSGFESNCLGTIKHFDCAYTDQSTIQGLTVTAMLIMNNLSTEVLRWKASNELECYPWTVEQILALAIDMKKHIEGNIEKFNGLRIAVNACTTKEEINNIIW